MSKKLLVVLLVIAVAIPAMGSLAPAGAQMEYNEAPMLAEKVAAGELPPVADRLPENPRVVGFEDSEIGVYGGIWNRGWIGVNDFHCYGRVNYDPVLRWPKDPNDPVQPGLAEAWEFNEDGTELTLHFRVGLKWSDGEPWTVNDVVFWWEHIENDPEITAAVHGEWATLTELVVVDDYTITLKFSGPNGLAETVGLAFHGNQWPLGFERFGFYAPEHYLTQFHPALTDGVTYEDFEAASFDYNVDRPVMTAWKITEYEEGTTLMIAERNPYYYGVDAEGNQLPYIDYQYYHFAEGNAPVNLMGIAGELDMQSRRLDLAQFPVFMENAEDAGYHMLLWPQASASRASMFFNQSYPDDKYRELFQTFEFRQAMSVAIDRDTINEVAYLGQGVPRTSTVVPDSPYYDPEYEAINAQYDPDLANQLLDDLGLAKGDDGWRTFSDGSELLLVIESNATSGAPFDTYQLVSEWWNAVGVRTELETMTREIYWPRAGANEVMVATWELDRGLVPMVDPIYQFPFDERSWMAPAYGIWYKSGGADGLEPTDEFKAAMALYDEYKVTTDSARQVEIGKELVKMSTTSLWTIPTVGMVPAPVVVQNNFMNVADSHTADWIIMTPGTMEPAHFFFAE